MASMVKNLKIAPIATFKKSDKSLQSKEGTNNSIKLTAIDKKLASTVQVSKSPRGQP